MDESGALLNRLLDLLDSVDGYGCQCVCLVSGERHHVFRQPHGQSTRCGGLVKRVLHCYFRVCSLAAIHGESHFVEWVVGSVFVE